MARKMKDSGVEWIGEIPADWEITKIKNKMEFINGYAFDSSSLKSSGKYSVIRIGDIVDGTINTKQANRIDYDDNTLEKYVIKDNDVIIAMSGATVGKLGYVNQISDKCYINQRVGIIRSQISRYIFYYLNTEEFLKYINLLAAGSAQPNISTENINNYFISVPSLQNEIEKIADFLDEKVGEIDSVIARTKETIEDYKKYKQAIITDAVTKGLNSDVEMKESSLQWVDLIPKHWIERKILHIISMPVIDGPHVSPELVDNGVPYISADAIENGKINFDRKRGFITKEYSEECNKRYKPQKNDILVVKLGASTGKMAIVGDETTFNIWVPLAVVRCKVGILPQYVFYSMESSYFKNEIRNGWTFGTQETLGVKTLEQLKVFVPSLEEQKEIAEYLDEKCFEIDKLIVKKEELLADLEDYKKSLIYEYVTGKREVE